MYMYKYDLSLNNQQWLVWHRTKPNQTKHTHKRTHLDLTDKMKCSFFQAAVVSILLYGCTTWDAN